MSNNQASGGKVLSNFSSPDNLIGKQKEFMDATNTLETPHNSTYSAANESDDENFPLRKMPKTRFSKQGHDYRIDKQLSHVKSRDDSELDYPQTRSRNSLSYYRLPLSYSKSMIINSENNFCKDHQNVSDKDRKNYIKKANSSINNNNNNFSGRIQQSSSGRSFPTLRQRSSHASNISSDYNVIDSNSGNEDDDDDDLSGSDRDRDESSDSDIYESDSEQDLRSSNRLRRNNNASLSRQILTRNINGNKNYKTNSMMHRTIELRRQKLYIGNSRNQNLNETNNHLLSTRSAPSTRRRSNRSEQQMNHMIDEDHGQQDKIVTRYKGKLPSNFGVNFASYTDHHPINNNHHRDINNNNNNSNSHEAKKASRPDHPISPMLLNDDNGNKAAKNFQQVQQLDPSITFESCGGLQHNIEVIRERIILPLLYPDLYKRLSISASKGILFYGPPGTGKTLMAKAIANECNNMANNMSNKNKSKMSLMHQPMSKVAFFACKGADLYSKWVGETEKNLKDLFESARHHRPAIIFFDELDGLAPSRSSSHDHAHNSCVATFLALLDGLEGRGNDVVVIGATNRLDSIDIALRRPGRFDREIKFDLPNYEARKRILQIHCSKLPKAPEESVIEFLAANTIQFCGADLKELCNQAALNFIKRSFPKIYGSNKRLKIAPIKDSCPTAQDYIASLEIVRPNSSKISSTDADFVASPRNLPRPLNLLFEDECKRLMEMLRGKYLIQDKTNLALLKNSQHMLSQRCGQNSTTILLEDSLNTFNRTMISLLGNDKPGFMQFFLPQLLADIEERSKNVVYLDLLNVSCFAQENSRSSANTMRQLIDKAASEKHSILVVNGIIEAANDDSDSSPFSSNFLTFLNYVHLWPNNQKCLILGIDSEATLEDFKKFSGNYGKIFTVAEFEYSEASETKKIDYLTEIVFAKLQVLMCLLEQLYASPIDQGAISKNAESHILKDQLNNMDEQSVALAALTSGQDEECSNEEEYDEEEALKCFRETLDDNDIKSINNNYHQMMRSLRIVLRTVLKYLLKDKRFNVFVKPVDPEEAEDYYTIIKEPICLADMIKKVDYGLYRSVKEFKNDIELIVKNAIEYNPDYGDDLMIRHRAFDLKDHCMDCIDSTIESDFEENLQHAIISYNTVNQVTQNKDEPTVDGAMNSRQNSKQIDVTDDNQNAKNKVDVDATEPDKPQSATQSTDESHLRILRSLISEKYSKFISSLNMDDFWKLDCQLSSEILRLHDPIKLDHSKHSAPIIEELSDREQFNVSSNCSTNSNIILNETTRDSFTKAWHILKLIMDHFFKNDLSKFYQ